jgi:hypothetical protein
MMSAVDLTDVSVDLVNSPRSEVSGICWSPVGPICQRPAVYDRWVHVVSSKRKKGQTLGGPWSTVLMGFGPSRRPASLSFSPHIGLVAGPRPTACWSGCVGGPVCRIQCGALQIPCGAGGQAWCGRACGLGSSADSCGQGLLWSSVWPTGVLCSVAAPAVSNSEQPARRLYAKWRWPA